MDINQTIKDFDKKYNSLYQHSKTLEEITNNFSDNIKIRLIKLINSTLLGKIEVIDKVNKLRDNKKYYLGSVCLTFQYENEENWYFNMDTYEDTYLGLFYDHTTIYSTLETVLNIRDKERDYPIYDVAYLIYEVTNIQKIFQDHIEKNNIVIGGVP